MVIDTTMVICGIRRVAANMFFFPRIFKLDGVKLELFVVSLFVDVLEDGFRHALVSHCRGRCISKAVY